MVLTPSSRNRVARRGRRGPVGGRQKVLAFACSEVPGGDASWTMHDHGLPLDRIPDAIARTVQLVVETSMLPLEHATA
jgi:hypothetical protein